MAAKGPTTMEIFKRITRASGAGLNSPQTGRQRLEVLASKKNPLEQRSPSSLTFETFDVSISGNVSITTEDVLLPECMGEQSFHCMCLIT